MSHYVRADADDLEGIGGIWGSTKKAAVVASKKLAAAKMEAAMWRAKYRHLKRKMIAAGN